MSDYAALCAPTAQTSQAVSVSTTSAQSTAFADGGDVIVTVTAPCFVVRGQNPTAAVNTSMYLPAGIPIRLHGIQPGDKLAFVAPTGTATAYLTQGA